MIGKGHVLESGQVSINEGIFIRDLQVTVERGDSSVTGLTLSSLLIPGGEAYEVSEGYTVSVSLTPDFALSPGDVLLVGRK